MTSPRDDNDQLTARTYLSMNTMDRHPWDGGRRYHVYREGRYSLPNDEIEQQREELMHILVMDILDQQLYLSPMAEPPKKVMDIATGIGIWAIEMGDQHPDATILGVDLSRIQPTSVPPNVTFQVDDIEDTWVHDSDYDLIHMREAAAYMRSTPAVIDNVIAHLKPGGWFEVQETYWLAEKEDGTVDPTCPVNRYMKYLEIAAAATEGRKIPIVPELGDIMERAGFVNISKKRYRIPYGTWSKDPAARQRGAVFTLTAELLMPASQKIISYAGMAPECVATLYDECVRMLHDNSTRYFATYYVWCGQKPRAAGDSSGADK